MNGGRSDASTSTDDVKGQGRPLCLFYFTQPFGVLSPEPPTLATAPAHFARAFLDMQPVSPFYWSSPTGAPAASDVEPPADSFRSTATGESFDLGAATVHSHPVGVVSVMRRRTLAAAADLPRTDSLSSSLFSGELWFESSCSSRGLSGAGAGAGVGELPRRLVPYNRILPPLRLPSARALSDYGSDDVWPRKCLHPEKFSLPPLELAVPTRATTARTSPRPAGTHTDSGGRVRDVRTRRRLGVEKRRGTRRADLRRVLVALVRRAVTEGRERCSRESSPSPALRRVLATIRAAWAEPTALRHRCGVLNQTLVTPPNPTPRAPGSMQSRATASPAAAGPPPTPPPRVHALPGLLRRRYSVPETIMRKYRLAQQCSESEESAGPAHRSTASACLSPPRDPIYSPCESPHRFMRRDRELMRKSALLRRMWTRPCRTPSCRCCEVEARATRSLDGSHSELSSRRSAAPCALLWASPKRQRLEADVPLVAELSNSTYRSHGGRRVVSSCVNTADAFTDSESRRLGSPPSSERATAEFESEERSPLDTDVRDDRSYDDSDTFSASASLSTAKETNGSTDAPPTEALSSNGRIERCVNERSAGVGNEDRDLHIYERALPVDAGTPIPLYELLEIVVSESANASASTKPLIGVETSTVSTTAPFALNNAHDINIDEYVSNILVESLNSLTDQLECMNASIGGDRRISIVEKEIKVRLQNTGVNTIVHLSPTSNNQIIFGNEELCNESCGPRDECNNPLLTREGRLLSIESNNNLSSSAGSGAPPAEPIHLSLESPQQRDVNKAVMDQIQKLFRDELRTLDETETSHIEISNVDAYMEACGAAQPELEISTCSDGKAIACVGAGNYFRDGDDAFAVQRFAAYPHTESMEVNTSSSSDAEAACSDCTSLVDSLDDPNSPRTVLLRRRVDLARTAVEVLDLLPESTRGASSDSRGEAFFVRIEDNNRDRDPDGANVRVAEYMPEKIKQRLYRRHRKRELRMECARRSKVKQLKKELERRRLEEAVMARRELERDCMAIVNALIDDVVAKIAQDEYKDIHVTHRNGKLTAARSEESLSRRSRRKELDDVNVKKGSSRRCSIGENRMSERHHIRGKLLARPSFANPDRPPRRIYQKSEIHEGEKCIEILEILEYVNGSQSSPETTTSDENHNQSSRCRKSRIPIPVFEKIQKTSRDDGRMRLTGGNGRRGPLLAESGSLASMLLEALSETPPAGVPTVPEPRSRSNSLRFKRVFDIIPEERSSLSFDSSVEDAELMRRSSAPEVSIVSAAKTTVGAPNPVATPAPAESLRCEKSTRSAGTSPLAKEEQSRVLRSQTTMTSPCSKSAATSPLRPPAPPRPAPPRPVREGRGRERVAETEALARVTRNERLVDGAGAPSPPLPRCNAVQGGEIRDAPTRRRGSERGARQVRLPPAAPPLATGSSSSDSGDSGGSLLCSLAPRWLSSHARQRRRARRVPPPPPPPHAAAADGRVLPAPHAPLADHERVAGGGGGGGDAGAARGWTVTVAGSCRAALPADVEMRLRFPQGAGSEAAAAQSHGTAAALRTPRYQKCSCVQCASCAGERAASPAASAAASDARLTLTVKKEAQDSSILATKSVRKSDEQLPELETYRASRTKLKSSVKTRRGYSLHCWLPDDEPAPIRVNNGLSVLGCAIIPELKPRVPTMSERDLTRVYTPRHYLRS